MPIYVTRLVNRANIQSVDSSHSPLLWGTKAEIHLKLQSVLPVTYAEYQLKSQSDFMDAHAECQFRAQSALTNKMQDQHCGNELYTCILNKKVKNMCLSACNTRTVTFHEM